MGFRDQAAPGIPSIAEALKIRSVPVGSVRKSGDKVIPAILEPPEQAIEPDPDQAEAWAGPAAMRVIARGGSVTGRDLEVEWNTVPSAKTIWNVTGFEARGQCIRLH